MTTQRAVLTTAAALFAVALMGCGSTAAPTPAPQTLAQTTETPSPSPSPSPSVVDLEMPNLVGKNAAVADDMLTKAGFTNVDFGSQDPDDKVVIMRSNWTVTKQSTKAGEKVKSDAKIVLTCTKQQ